MALDPVQIPPRMRSLPVDRRGYPVPFIVVRDKDGVPHFTINNHELVMKCIKEDLCAICGQKLFRFRWFVGGPLSAFHESGCYNDTPLHHECAQFALRVCPHLAAPKYSKRIGENAVDRVNADFKFLVDTTMIPERPIVFVSAMSTGQKYITPFPGVVRVHPIRPYRRVEYWRHGSQLPSTEGEKLTRAALEAFDAADKQEVA